MKRSSMKKTLPDVLSSSFKEFKKGFTAYPDLVRKDMKKAHNVGTRAGAKARRKSKGM